MHATATAASTSERSDRATDEMTSPVAGESFSKVAPPAASRSSPSITFPTKRVAVAELVTTP